MTTTVLFAGIPVADFESAVDWYSRLFGRAPDILVHSQEVMWRVAVDGWVYVLLDADRAGHALVTISVPNLDRTMAEITARGFTCGPVEAIGDAGRKALVDDREGNRIAFIEVVGATT